MSLPQPPLLLITDSAQAYLPLLEVVTAAFEAGCRWVSLREKALPAAHRAALLDRLVARASAHDAVAMVHGDIAAAAKAGAGGIHLSGPAQVAEARTVLGLGCLIGVSAHDEAEIAAAAAAGADYVTLSPIFPSPSKPGYGPALGLEGLAALAGRSALPVIALGGITTSSARTCLAAGAAGIAVMGEVMRSAAPAAVTSELLQAIAGHPRTDG
jgi:thiamine-phosphate pyrophosphorylase